MRFYRRDYGLKIDSHTVAFVLIARTEAHAARMSMLMLHEQNLIQLGYQNFDLQALVPLLNRVTHAARSLLAPRVSKVFKSAQKWT